MDLDLELKDDYIKRFVHFYNMALKCDDEEMMEIFYKAMAEAISVGMVYSLDKVLKLL